MDDRITVALPRGSARMFRAADGQAVVLIAENGVLTYEHDADLAQEVSDR